jgi:hypothetical protein
MVAVKRALIVLGCVAAALIVVRAVAFSATGDWPTYQHGPGRSELDANQAAVTSISPAWTTALNGAVSAQPLVVGTTVYARDGKQLGLRSAKARFLYCARVEQPPRQRLRHRNRPRYRVVVSSILTPAAA